MVTQTTEIREKYAAIMKQALDDSKAAGDKRIVSVWYSMYFNDFILSAGYASYVVDGEGKIKNLPHDEKAVKLAAVCHEGIAVHEPSAGFFNKCRKSYEGFDEKASEEYIFMALSFKGMAEQFPLRAGDTLTNPIFWQKVADTALARKTELETT